MKWISPPQPQTPPTANDSVKRLEYLNISCQQGWGQSIFRSQRQYRSGRHHSQKVFECFGLFLTRTITQLWHNLCTHNKSFKIEWNSFVTLDSRWGRRMSEARIFFWILCSRLCRALFHAFSSERTQAEFSTRRKPSTFSLFRRKLQS